MKRRTKVSARKTIFRERERERAMRAGSRCEKGWGTGFERSLITKERENAEGKKNKRRNWAIVGINDVSILRDKLMGFSK